MSGLANDFPTFLIELETSAAGGAEAYIPPVLNQSGAGVVGGVDDGGGAPTVPEPVVLRYSDRGWTGEPGDADRPNIAYPARMAEAPRLERSIRYFPEENGRASFEAGRVVLINDDAALNFLAADFSLSGRRATLFRMPRQSPLAAPFVSGRRLAEMRVSGRGLVGGKRLRLTLRDAGVDFAVPITPSFTGAGGLDGPAELIGQGKPLLLGYGWNMEPAWLNAATRLGMLSTGRLSLVLAVRDQGVPLLAAGDAGTMEQLNAMAIPEGRYATCLAQGLIRLGSQPIGQVTVDAIAFGATNHRGILQAVATGPGGLPVANIAANTFGQVADLAALDGAAGFLWTRGSVAEAMDDIARSALGWWGTDRWGRLVARTLVPPEAVEPAANISALMLSESATEEEAQPQRWRARASYLPLAVTQAESSLSPGIRQDAVRVRFYGSPYSGPEELVTEAVRASLGSVDSSILQTNYTLDSGAKAMCRLLERLYSVVRRAFRIRVDGYAGLADVGQVITVDDPLMVGRRWLIVGSSEQGDRVTWKVWG